MTTQVKDDVARRNFLKGGLCMLGASGWLPAWAGAADATAPPAADGWSAAQVLADFEELYARLRESHYDLYARRSRAEYDAKFKNLRRTFETPLPRDRVLIDFQRFMAFGRVAHAYCGEYWAPFQKHMAAGGRQFPLNFKVVEGRAHITANLSGSNDIAVGDELTRVNRLGFATLRPRLHAYLSADNPYLADTLLEQQVPIALWFEFGGVEEFEVEIRKPAGATSRLTLAAVAWGEVAARQAANKPTAKTDWNQRAWKLLEGDIGYLRPGPFYNHEGAPDKMYDNTAFGAFVDEAFRGLIKSDVRKLVIDVRNNPGGDNSFSDLLVSWVASKPFKFASDFRIKVSQAAIDSNRKRIEALSGIADSSSARLAAAYAGHKPGELISYEIPIVQPRAGERYQGACYLLVNRYSYSNAVSISALMQDHGFAKVLGEETADLATSYGAMEQFKLSRTGIDIGFPKAFIIRPNGNTAARGVIPDVPIETPLLEGIEDDVLARAVEIMKGAGREVI